MIGREICAVTENKSTSRPFDPEWYTKTYPDVAASGLDPQTHFERYGQLLGRSAHPTSKQEPGARAPLPAPGLRTRPKRHAGVATMANRGALFEQAFTSIADQMDTIDVYINGHAEVPSLLKALPNVRVFLSDEHDDIGDAGKFYTLGDYNEGFFFSFDDDILYPPDYSSRLIEAVERYGCPSGVHGSLLRRDIQGYYDPRARYVLHFRNRLDRDTPVDVLGTGTLCFDIGRTPLSCTFAYRNMADLWVARAFAERDVPLVCVSRPDGWLKPIETNEPSIWQSNRGERTVQQILVEREAKKLAAGPRPKTAALPRIFIGIKTFNRIDYLRNCIDSLMATLDAGFEYVVAVADDGSTDGTLEYLSNLRLPLDFTVVYNNKRYASGQFNDLVRMAMRRRADFMIIVDDDVVFKKAGWISGYFNAARHSGYPHLCHYNLPHHAQLAPRRGVSVVPEKHKSIAFDLTAYGNVEGCMGALITLTPEVVDRIGLADETNFFIRGQWHVDFSARACRAGFNEYSRFFDWSRSNDYIELQNTLAREYQTSIAWESDEFKRAAKPEEVARRKAIVRIPDRIFADAEGPYIAIEATVRPDLTINEFFDRVVVLNLDRRPDRLATITRRLEALDIEFQRVSAIDGQSEDIIAAYARYVASVIEFPPSQIQSSREYYQGGHSMAEQARYLQAKSKAPAIRSAGAWAYLLSYRAILASALADGVERLLVLDDDCKFHKNFRSIFSKAASELPKRWRTIHLGTMQMNWNFTESYSPHLYLPHGSIVASHAVGYSNMAMPEIINRIDMMSLPYDVGPLQQDAMRYRDQTFVLRPDLAIQDNFTSDISSSDVAHTEVTNVQNRYRWVLNDYAD